jgi:hypothetical protein
MKSLKISYAKFLQSLKDVKSVVCNTDGKVNVYTKVNNYDVLIAMYDIKQETGYYYL